MHHFTPKQPLGRDFASRSVCVDLLDPHARFYERHGVLLGISLFALVPELLDAAGARDVTAARLLMELLLAKGTDWTLMEWMNGNLDGLLGGGALRALNGQLAAELEHLRRLAGQQREQLGAAEQRLADREQELADREQELADRERGWATSERASAEREELIWFLIQHNTLERVENGGWWALRQRSLPALRVLWRLRGRDEGGHER